MYLEVLALVVDIVRPESYLKVRVIRHFPALVCSHLLALLGVECSSSYHVIVVPQMGVVHIINEAVCSLRFLKLRKRLEDLWSPLFLSTAAFVVV